MTNVAVLAGAANGSPPAFNTDLYVTAATVIPVLFLAIAVQGRIYETLLNNAVSAARGYQRAQRCRPRYKTVAAEIRYLWPATVASLVLVCGALGELAAIAALQSQVDIGVIQTFVSAAVMALTIVAAAGPAQILMKSALTIRRQLNPGHAQHAGPETTTPSAGIAEVGKTDTES